ncbi:MAG: hypothetical protein COA67_04670 [Lutibacter sp.]|nr:MAG: hypothetical protein COA67_04670 [Lutibacter sp.]
MVTFTKNNYLKQKKNILLVEDFSDSAKGVIARLHDIPEYELSIDWVDNCDDAFEKLNQKHNYDLLITDLQINTEDKKYTIETGEDLLIKIKKLDNNPKIIVYSMIDQPVILDLIINEIVVDGYIIKGRKSLDELAFSLHLIFLGSSHFSKNVNETLIKYRDALHIDKLNRNILRYLYKGYKINELSSLLTKKGFKATSQATIENRIKDLKDYFDAKTTIQLVAIAKEKKVFMD